MVWGLLALLPRVLWLLPHPMLIVESNDWGPGPQSQTDALRRLISCLNRHHDGTGRSAVMTLGVTLSLPDGEAIAASGFSSYHARPITDPAYADILAAMRQGIRAGVFVPQLHGMAHYWPAALMRAARQDSTVRDWVRAGSGQETEHLPSPLQSRWVDGSVLPSAPLSAAEIESAVAEEVSQFSVVFGATPAVAVPPTFVWTVPVEAAWAANGVGAIVTPGHACMGRDAVGRPDCASATIHNGQRGMGGITYLVRVATSNPHSAIAPNRASPPSPRRPPRAAPASWKPTASTSWASMRRTRWPNWTRF